MPKKRITKATSSAREEWLLPRNWAWARNDEVGSVQLGVQRTPERDVGIHFTKYLRVANITDRGLDLRDVAEMHFSEEERQRYQLRPQDLLVVESSGTPAQLGRVAMWNGELPACCFQNHLIRFRAHAVWPPYALSVFRYRFLTGAFTANAHGIGIQHIGKGGFSEMAFPLPPLGEQKRIAIELAHRFEAIRDSEKSILSALAHIREQVPAVLEAAFSGAILGRSHVPLKKTEFASLPSHWQVLHVDEVGELKLGKPKTSDTKKRQHLRPYLRVANVFEDRIDDRDILQMSFPPPDDQDYRVQMGDILLNEGQSPELVGRPAMYRGKPPDVCFQGNLIRFRSKHGVDAEFALLIFRHYLHSGRFKAVARWSTNIAHLGHSRFAKMLMPIPPLDEQKKIVAEAHRRLEAAEAQRTASERALNNLRVMEVDTLRVALTGGLVGQIESEGTAGELLKRLGNPPIPEKVARKKRGGETAMSTRGTESREAAVSMKDILKSIGGEAKVETLFIAAGYNRDSIEDVEQFYLQLRDDLKHGAEVEVKESGALLRLSDDAS
jgi:type I restriction enzyme S subunit